VRERANVLMDDAAAIDAVLAGDADAYADIVERYQQVTFRTAYLIVRDGDVAEDVAQEAFIRAYRELRRFRRGSAFRPWLLRIATNLALNHVRGRGRLRAFVARIGPAQPRSTPGPSDAVLQGERQRLLLEAIQELAEDDRVVLYLRHFLELPEREIAAAIGKRPGTVKSRLSRARGRLRAVVEERYPSLVPEDVVAGDAVVGDAVVGVDDE
jgi:RNA polymerase sigma-70 factor (ECF subfamily)